MKLKTVIFLTTLLFASDVLAQDDNSLFQKALSAYNVGHFQQVEDILSQNIETLDASSQVQAYRLLVLSSLYRDMPEKAEMYAAQLLKLDPFYTAYGDSPRFSDILDRLKKGSSTITSASKMAETVEEVPVPVTLITEDMIRASGAVRLQDIIMQYVPGLSAVSSLENNVAMRGVYGLGQETILVLLNGHRLNSSSANSESFDFRNSVDKIKQIEVLRGPASSLYGNVALTAVVNIITKSGTDLDGGRISGMTGSNSSVGGSLMIGSGNLQSDYMVWASIYNSEGQIVRTGNSPHYVEGYNTKPTFDLGTNIRWGDFNIAVTGQHGHPTPYFNILSLGETFTYDAYGEVNGERPGMARTNVRADVEWNHSWNDFSISTAISGATERMQIYNVLGDTVAYEIMNYLAGMIGIPTVKTRGARQIVAWDDFSFGGTVTGAYNYSFDNSYMNGTLLAGVQFEDIIIGDASLLIGADFNETNNVRHSIILDGVERTLSGFLQIKHYFSKELIFNGGLRYDYKHRLDDRVLNTTSPRISLIWIPNQRFNLKGAYSHAFVDAAVFYRGSTISLFSGGTELNPEIMDSYQICGILNWKDIGLKFESNIFYNDVKDMVYFAGASNGKTFTNAGSIRMGGIENVVQWTSDRALVNVNATYQYPFKVESIAASEHSVLNVPRFLGNMTAKYALTTSPKGGSLSVRANMHAQSAFDCQTNDLLKVLMVGKSEPYKEDGYVTFGAGLEWKWNKGITIDFDVYNITDTQYEIGGQLLRGVPGSGRSVMARLAYDF